MAINGHARGWDEAIKYARSEIVTLEPEYIKLTEDYMKIRKEALQPPEREK